MPSERHQRPPPRERTFAELFPWRNIRRALMLVLLILAIVMMKRSAGPLLARMGEMWGSPISTPAGVPGLAPAGVPGGDSVHRVRLGPGLAPQIPATDARAR